SCSCVAENDVRSLRILALTSYLPISSSVTAAVIRDELSIIVIWSANLTQNTRTPNS
ncbi:MAG: hypothetical protein ACI81Q_001111, partial [Paracoccaceae bacterium]